MIKGDQLDDLDGGLSHLLLLGLVREISMHRIRLITFIALLPFVFSCQESQFNQEDLYKLQSKSKCEKCDLRGAEFDWADLRVVNLTKTRLMKANLSYANLTKGNLYKANLYQANLKLIQLEKANLTEANLWGEHI